MDPPNKRRKVSKWVYEFPKLTPFTEIAMRMLTGAFLFHTKKSEYTPDQMAKAYWALCQMTTNR